MRELVHFLVSALVEDPGAVTVEETVEDGEVMLDVHVAEDDMGRVIGRNGRVVAALRVVARAAATGEGRHVTVEIVD